MVARAAAVPHALMSALASPSTTPLISDNEAMHWPQRDITVQNVGRRSTSRHDSNYFHISRWYPSHHPPYTPIHSFCSHMTQTSIIREAQHVIGRINCSKPFATHQDLSHRMHSRHTGDRDGCYQFYSSTYLPTSTHRPSFQWI